MPNQIDKPNPYKARMFWGAAFFIGAALLFDDLLAGPKIYIDQNSANIAGIFLLSMFFLILLWIIAANFKRQNTRALKLSGLYGFLRAPLPAAFLFFILAAAALLLKSWLMLFAIIPIYTIWTQIIETKEAWLAQKYGQDYLVYQKQTGLFLPRLRQLNKAAFYGASALVIFVVLFVGLNFSSVYLRWVTFERNDNTIASSQIYSGQAPETNSANQIFQTSGQPQNIGLLERIFGTNPTSAETSPSPAPPQQNSLDSARDKSGQVGTNAPQPISTPAPSQNFISEPNTIIIKRINTNAPIIAARGVSQKELNTALDNGVVLYPGSALPGENGEVLLTGHSSVFPWNKTKYGQVFTLLDKLKTGDIVTLIYNNQRYDYKITSQEILKPEQVNLSSTREARLTLTTCWPIGTALKRLVVRGVLVR